MSKHIDRIDGPCPFDTDGDGDCNRCIRLPGGCPVVKAIMAPAFDRAYLSTADTLRVCIGHGINAEKCKRVQDTLRTLYDLCPAPVGTRFITWLRQGVNLGLVSNVESGEIWLMLSQNTVDEPALVT